MNSFGLNRRERRVGAGAVFGEGGDWGQLG